MRGLRKATGLILSLLFMTGCASVRTDEEWGKLKKTISERTGQEPRWEQTAKEERAVKKEVNRLLSGGLSREEAVKIALMNNRQLQGVFEEIGISKSNLVQAGLFRNPTLGALFRFPFEGGSTNIEIIGGMSISDFWQIPIRKKVASAQLEKTMMRVARKVLSTVAETKRAFDSVYYLRAARDEIEEIFKKFQVISERVKVRRRFGFTSDLDIYMSQSMVSRAEMELVRTESDITLAKAHLNRVLGLKGVQTDYKIHYKEPEISPTALDLEKAIEYAIAHRFDVQMARFKINEAERRLEFEKVRILKDISIEANYEKDSDGEEVFGPGVDIQLPIFDQNQAQIAKAAFQVRKAKRGLQALTGKIREEIITDLARISFNKRRISLYKEKLIPTQKKAVAYAEKWVSAMQLNRLYLLETQKILFDTRKAYVSTLMELNQAFTDLELHLGGKILKTKIGS